MNVKWYARRLLEMEPDEIAARAAEYLPAEPGPPPRWTPPRPAVVARRLERGFLFGPASGRDRVQFWQLERPDDAARLVELARRALDCWEVFGVSVQLRPGETDWHAGDLRWAWELSRHQYLFLFARASVLTGDPRFAERAAALAADWRARNPYGRGPHWSSALEVAVRALSWLWALPLLWPSPSLWHDWLVGLYEHHYFLKTHLSIYTDPTNHLIGETAALWLLSVALPDLPGAAAQERRALQILTREVARQVSPDGVSREQSTGYQRFVLDFCRQVLAVAKRSGRRLPPVLEQRTEAMAAFLALLGGDRAPTIGDSDDGRAVPLCEPSPDLRWWLDGAETPPTARRLFPHGGYCYWEAGELASFFDVGPLGLWPHASHGHADALSLQVRVGDCWLVADPGTGAYGSDPRVRDLLRGTAAHNTVTVDGLDQADPLDLFKWMTPVPTRLVEARSNSRYDYALGLHEGYCRLRQPVTHYRSVLFVRPPAPDAGWIVMDRLEGAGRHRCALRFHFPPAANWQFENSRALTVSDPATGAGLRLTFSEPGWRLEEGLWSRRFGHWETAPVVVLERSAELPLLWLTTLTPLR
jgi:uncharacterized heparinase superfamily protein